MGRALTQLRTQLREIGLNLSVWDENGRLAGKFQTPCQFCQMAQESRAGCIEAAESLAIKLMHDGRQAQSVSPCGCSLIGVPIYQRRRLLGAAVACYLPRSLVEDEAFNRLCDRLKIDRQAALGMAQPFCRHELSQADDFLKILGWMLAREQAVQTSQEELGNLSANLASTYEELGLLYAITGSMNINRQPRDFLQNVCSQILEVMNISAAAAVVHAKRPSEDEIVVVAGDMNLDAVQIKLLADEFVARKLIRDQDPAIENDFGHAYGAAGNIRNLIAVPLVSDERTIGVLMGFNKRSGDFNSVDVKLISSLGTQTAVFLEYSRLYADMKDLLMGVLHAMTASIDAKDPYTCGHSQRVAIISKRLAEACGLSAEHAQRIYLAGLLHDVGKIGVPESVLRKPGRLTDEEYDSVKRHPAIGARILGGIRQLEDVVEGIVTHHERLDGRGYPRGLKGDQVPLEGRILGLADSFDAMTSDRTYRRAMSLTAVTDEIKRNAGTQLDAVLVDKLLSMDLSAFMDELSILVPNPLGLDAIGSKECK
jgi:putative nucleotidyltransferase with HDIG domain